MLMNRNCKSFLKAASASSLLMMMSANVFAARAFDEVGADWVQQLKALMGFGIVIFMVIGVILFGIGLLYFYKDNKQPGQGHLKTGVIALLVGTALLLLSWLIGMFTETMAGEGSAVESTVSDSSMSW